MRSIGEFFTDLTDFDNKLLKTVIDLFRRPSHVVEAYLSGQTTYIKPLRYALLTPSFFVITGFLYELLFGKEDNLADWFVPIRVTSYLERLGNFTDSFFPFLLLLTIVPLAILVLKILFKKPWRDSSVIILYAFSQMWVLMIVTVFTPEFDMDDFLQPLVCFSIIFVCFRKVIAGNLFVALGKWIIMTMVLIIWHFEIGTHLVEFTFAKLTVKGTNTQLLRADTVTPTVMSMDVPEKSWWNFPQNDPDSRVLILTREGEATRIKFRSPDNKELYDLQVEGSVKKVTKISLTFGTRGWMIFHNLPEKDSIQELRATITSSSGKKLYTKSYREKVRMVLNSGAVVNGSTLLLAGGKLKDGEIVPFIDAIEFSLVNDNLNVIGEKNYTLPHIRQRFKDLYVLESTPERITLIVSKYENSAFGIAQVNSTEITQFSIAKVTIDSTIHEDWEKVIFHKTTKYSPYVENFHIKADTFQDKIMASYSLANKEVIATNFYYLTTDGTLLWEKEWIVDDYTFITDYYTDSTGVYFCGRTASNIPKHPIVNYYGLGMLGYISSDGKIVKKSLYGKFRNNSFQYFTKLIVKRDSIKVFDYSTSENILGKRIRWEILSFKNDFVP